MYAYYASMRRFSVIFLFTFLVSALLSAQSIRPVPHEVHMQGNRTLNLSKGVVLSDPNGVFTDASDLLTLNPKGVKLAVDFGTSIAEQAGVKLRSGAYRLEITAKGIILTGYDERGVLYGFQTLRQIIDQSDDMRVSCSIIYDWPDAEFRGFVDSYYGGIWSQEFRLSMIELASRLKMSAYVYAPKNDPFVGNPDWIMPYPQGRSDNLKELMDACRRNGIDFIWCIRPDKDFTWSESDYGLLLGKFEMMHYLGVRSFGIFFDDAPYVEDVEKRKKELVERLNADFIAKKKGLKPLMTSLEECYVPAEGGVSLKLGLYGIADRLWNTDAYDSMESLKWAVTEIAPSVADPYLTFARHSSVAVDAFGMEESQGVELIGLKGYGKESYDALMREFRFIESVPSAFASATDQTLYAELKPTLDEFGKLGTRCRRILECIDLHNNGDVPGFWATYAANLMSDKERDTYLAHPSGTQKLYPYYERMMKELADAFSQAYKGKVEYTFIAGDGIQTYIAPEEASRCHLILDNPEGHEVVIRLSDAKGDYTAEFCIDNSYFEFEMKDDAVMVEVIGNTGVFEAVFVK